MRAASCACVRSAKMYSQPGGRPGQGRQQGKYMKGRLPEGVEFGQYPGRSSTPLPTAESKSAERINQLKIWNEAATGSALKPGSSQPIATNRRTDSFKDARDRHSSSFQDQNNTAKSNEKKRIPRDDIYADRSDDEDDEDDDDDDDGEDDESTTNDPHTTVTAASGQPVTNASNVSQSRAPPNQVPSSHHHHHHHQHSPPVNTTTAPIGGSSASPPSTQPKENKGCCVLS